MRSCQNGRQAVDILEKNDEFEAVLMDIQMPEMDGIQATKIIRKQSAGKYRDLPIIAMTAHAMSGDMEKSLAAGMNDHLTKPVDPEVLFATLAQWIKPGPYEHGKTLNIANKPDGDENFGPPLNLSGVNVADGLKRVMGNKKFYEKILMRVKTDYENVGLEIENALGNNDIQKAVILVHSVKGVAGNIGAYALEDAAAGFENTLNSDDGDLIDKNKLTFMSALKSLMFALADFLPDNKIEKIPVAPVQPSDLPMLVKALYQLKEPVEFRMPTNCALALKNISKLSWPEIYGTDLEKIYLFIRQYEFEKAGVALKTLISRIKKHDDNGE
ncbi:MAG: response regulator [Desulfobacteraceae bacterium]|nr:response regulator [Desulfobacteraceae bacterium]